MKTGRRVFAKSRGQRCAGWHPCPGMFRLVLAAPEGAFLGTTGPRAGRLRNVGEASRCYDAQVIVG
jgi:hypothetical protein